MRLTKNDPTGNYAYFTDGLSPASAVLSDNYSTFTPGISEYNALGTRFYLADASGNSRGLLDSTQAATDGYNWDAFGNLVSRFGSNPTMLAWNEASGYQSDSDDGLTLLGHRYYDKRTGRFISQDPSGDGDNWYAYVKNNPTDATDPSGLSDGLPGSLGAPDQHYGGLGGYLGDDPAGLFGGTSGLNGFFASEDAAMERGRQGYIRSEIANALQELLFDENAAKGYLTYHGFKPKEVKLIKYLLKLIDATPVGHEMLQYATKSSHDYQIINKKGTSEANLNTGPIYIDLNYHPTIDTLGRNDMPASSLRMLAHEFGHAVYGYGDSYDPANANPGNQMMNVDKVENPIMTSIAGPDAARLYYP